jgi:hypothetical protein
MEFRKENINFLKKKWGEYCNQFFKFEILLDLQTSSTDGTEDRSHLSSTLLLLTLTSFITSSQQRNQCGHVTIKCQLLCEFVFQIIFLKENKHKYLKDDPGTHGEEKRAQKLVR